MTPTPTYSSGQSHPHLRISRLRRPRNANPYESPPQSRSASTRVAITPLVDEGADDPNEHSDTEDEDLEIDQDGDLDEDEEVDDGDEEFGEHVSGDGDEEDDEEGGIEEVHTESKPPFDPAALGLKEIGNLASWTVSSSKPGCGVEALRDDDTSLFWQSDGPQPHHLNIHFSRLVSILSIRIFLDFAADESYTPTRIVLLAGTGYHDLIQFSELKFERPSGWVDVPLEHVGGGRDGRTLRAFLVQVRIMENHQNGKDTHVRGLKVYARDEKVVVGDTLSDGTDLISEKRKSVMRVLEDQGGDGIPSSNPSIRIPWLVEPDWMGEPELR